VIVGRLIPAGTGMAYHNARKNAPPAQLFEKARPPPRPKQRQRPRNIENA